VILMTLYGSEDVVVRALRLGVRDYIPKPFDIDELLAAIDRVLEKGRLQRERERLVAEIGKANQKLMLRMRELSALQAVGRSVASLMPKEELLRRILDAAISLTGADAGALFLVDSNSDKLRLEAVRQGRMYHSGLLDRIQDSHAEDVLRSGRAQWITRATKRTGVTAYLGQKAHSLLYTPVMLGGEAIGVMGVARLQERRALSTDIESRLMTLADYAAIALKNAQLYESSRRQARQLTTINRIAQLVGSRLDLKDLMQAVVHSVRENLRVESARLVLLDEGSQELSLEIMSAEEGQRRGPFRVKLGQGVVGWVVQNAQSLCVNDVAEDPRFRASCDEAIGSHNRSVLCVPLLAKDRVIGAIEAINKIDEQLPGKVGRFAGEDEDLLHGAAAFVAIAAENALLHAATRETIAAQTLHDTMVTLCHYVNNPLQTLMGAAEVLKTELGCAGEAGNESPSRARGRTSGPMTQVLDLIDDKVREIAVVLSVLRDIGVPESTVYLGSGQMLDVEQELQARLEAVASITPSQVS
jgi:GAF domain-containing protein